MNEKKHYFHAFTIFDLKNLDNKALIFLTYYSWYKPLNQFLKLTPFKILQDNKSQKS